MSVHAERASCRLTILALGLALMICTIVITCSQARGFLSSHLLTPEAPAKVFDRILVEVKQKARIPLLLPSQLPPPIDEATHAFIGSISDETYEIFLYYKLPAVEATFGASFIGRSGVLPDWVKKRKPVKLASGLKGYFSPQSCGGSCTPPQIHWQMDQAYYSVALKLLPINEEEQEKLMVGVVDSAILGAVR